MKILQVSLILAVGLLARVTAAEEGLLATEAPKAISAQEIIKKFTAKEDDLKTYVFDATPKQLEKGKRYFQGRIWVDDHDFQIVRMAGKSVPDILPKKHGKGKGQENLFPKFTTYREQIDGKYWYPTFSM